MSRKLNIRIFLTLALCPGFIPVHGAIAGIGHYSQALQNSIVNYDPGHNSHKHRMANTNPNPNTHYEDEEIMVPGYIYPYLLLALWITCITSIICCCLYCKCRQAEQMAAAYNPNGFELQEVHVMDHPLPHVKGCVCLGCLQRKVAQELQQRTEQ